MNARSFSGAILPWTAKLVIATYVVFRPHSATAPLASAFAVKELKEAVVISAAEATQARSQTVYLATSVLLSGMSSLVS